MNLTDQIRAQLRATGLSQNHLFELFEEAGQALTRATIAKLISDEPVSVDAATLNKAFVLLGEPIIKFPKKQWPARRTPGRKPKQ